MQLEHAILILFSTIRPLAGLKYDSINYCQESPGAKPFSRRMFRGAPWVIMGLFSLCHGVWGHVAQPHPAQLPCCPVRSGITHAAPLAPVLGLLGAFSALHLLAR